MERRLAVILAVDVVGFSHLMEMDEARTHRALRSSQSAIEAEIAKHGGRVFGTAGDALMAEFHSPLAAVEATVRIQREQGERDLDLPDGNRMLFRAGITLGDVIVDEGNLFGDGVNLAARLQTMAPPGGICISANVHEHVENKLAVQFRDIGECHVKNISRPIHVYSVEVDRADESLLTVTSIETFASNWLAPRLAGFQESHPEIAIRLDATGRVVDLTREGIDVGIRSGDGSWPGLEAHRIMPIEFTPLLSPELMARAGPVRDPADLLSLPLLDGRDGWWKDWFSMVGLQDPKLVRHAPVQLITQVMLSQAVLAGHGVALLVPALFEPEIAAGRLVRPFDLACRSPTSYWLVYPEEHRKLRKVCAFRDWILGEAAPPQAAPKPEPAFA
jgi:LysR family glycine cleavage system transcriptional activator